MKPILNTKAVWEPWRLIGQISMLLAGLATLALVIFSRLHESAPDSDYAVAMGGIALLKEKLDHTMLIGALVLIALTAVTTWLIALYSSFRVMGPLFRLARNLELLIKDRRSKLLPLRNGDRLHQEAAELNASQKVVLDHIAGIKVVIDQCRCDLENGTSDEAIKSRVMEVRRLANHAQL